MNDTITNDRAVVEAIRVEAITPNMEKRVAHAFIIAENPESREMKKKILRSLYSDYAELKMCLESPLGETMCRSDSGEELRKAMKDSAEAARELVSASGGGTTRVIFAEPLLFEAATPVFLHEGDALAYSINYATDIQTKNKFMLYVIQAADTSRIAAIRQRIDEIASQVAMRVQAAETNAEYEDIPQILNEFGQYINNDPDVEGFYQIISDLSEKTFVTWNEREETFRYGSDADRPC